MVKLKNEYGDATERTSQSTRAELGYYKRCLVSYMCALQQVPDCGKTTRDQDPAPPLHQLCRSLHKPRQVRVPATGQKGGRRIVCVTAQNRARN